MMERRWAMNTQGTKGNKNNFHSIINCFFRPTQVPVYRNEKREFSVEESFSSGYSLRRLTG